MEQQARWVYDGRQWHRPQPGTYDPARRVVLPLCGATPVPGVHFAYELTQGRRCQACQARRAQEQG